MSGPTQSAYCVQVRAAVPLLTATAQAFACSHIRAIPAKDQIAGFIDELADGFSRAPFRLHVARSRIPATGCWNRC